MHGRTKAREWLVKLVQEVERRERRDHMMEPSFSAWVLYFF